MPGIASVRRSWRRYLALRADERRLFWQALRCLAAIQLTLKRMPLAALLAKESLIAVPANSDPLPIVDPALARAIHLGVVRASRALPFRPACLVRSLAEARVRRLTGLPAELNIGFRGDKHRLSGHAWMTGSPAGAAGHVTAARFRHLPHKI